MVRASSTVFSVSDQTLDSDLRSHVHGSQGARRPIRLFLEESLEWQTLETSFAFPRLQSRWGSVEHEQLPTIASLASWTDQEKQLHRLQTRARHLLALSDELLDLAKIESGKVEVNFEHVPYMSGQEDVATALRRRLNRKASSSRP